MGSEIFGYVEFQVNDLFVFIVLILLSYDKSMNFVF
jgi:hypothetical protein